MRLSAQQGQDCPSPTVFRPGKAGRYAKPDPVGHVWTELLIAAPLHQGDGSEKETDHQQWPEDKPRGIIGKGSRKPDDANNLNHAVWFDFRKMPDSYFITSGAAVAHPPEIWGGCTLSDFIEPFGVPDIYISGLADIEELAGGNFRFTFYTRQRVGGTGENIIVSKHIMAASVAAAIVLACEQSPALSACVAAILGKGAH